MIMHCALSACFAMAALACFGTTASGAELTARDVLDKSGEAMKAPIQFRMTIAGVESICSQKLIRDGILSVRVETDVPGLSRVSLSTSEEQYEWFPKVKLNLDMSIVRKGMIKQVTDLQSSLVGQPNAGAARLLPNVVRDGQLCYVVEQSTPEPVLSAMARVMPPGTPLPALRRSVINKETFLLIEVSTLTSATAPPVQVATFSDVQKRSDLPNELFLPPDGYEIKKVQSMKEYASLVSAIVKGGTPDSLPVKRYKPELLGRVTIDPDTGLAVVPVPKGMTRAQFDEMTRPDFVNTTRDQVPTSRFSNRTRFVITLLSLVFLSAAIVVWLRKSRIAKRR